MLSFGLKHFTAFKCALFFMNRSTIVRYKRTHLLSTRQQATQNRPHKQRVFEFFFFVFPFSTSLCGWVSVLMFRINYSFRESVSSLFILVSSLCKNGTIHWKKCISSQFQSLNAFQIPLFFFFSTSTKAIWFEFSLAHITN